MIKKEYGGYLPLETRTGEDYFSRYGKESVVRTNSAKAAIYFAALKMNVKKLYVPYYLCDSVLRMLGSSGIRVEQYWLDEQLLPALEKKEEDAGILLVNYFGIMDERIQQEAQKYKNVIIDNSHAFFSTPLFREDVYNVYSCRKFVGVPDGGYLVSQTKLDRNLEPDKVSRYFSYLAVSSEYGMNEAYAEKLESDRHFYDNYKGMSELSQNLLIGTDYGVIREKRRENFYVLHKLLDQYNWFAFEKDSIPAYLYPFYPKGSENGDDIKKRLIARKIYTPTLWRELICSKWKDRMEYRISKNTIFLPVDQRYDREDMAYLAQTVLDMCGIKEKGVAES